MGVLPASVRRHLPVELGQLQAIFEDSTFLVLGKKLFSIHYNGGSALN